VLCHTSNCSAVHLLQLPKVSGLGALISADGMNNSTNLSHQKFPVAFAKLLKIMILCSERLISLQHAGLLFYLTCHSQLVSNLFAYSFCEVCFYVHYNIFYMIMHLLCCDLNFGAL